MVLGFVLLFVEIHTLATVYLEFPTGQSQLQEKENGTHQGSELKADISVYFARFSCWICNHVHRFRVSVC